MKIAFDVKGTLEGHKGKFVLGLLNYLQGMGHEITIWSNGPGFAAQCAKDLGLTNVATMMKYGKGDHQELFDIAVEDDTSQNWLAAKRFVWVKDIPDGMGGVLKLAHVLNEGNEIDSDDSDDIARAESDAYHDGDGNETI